MERQTARLLTLQEAAERLNVHYMTAYRWVRRGDLPALKTGGRLRVRVADLEGFLAERELDRAMSDRPTNQTDWDRHVQRLTAALLVGDASLARSEVQKVISDGATAGNVYVHLIAPALHEVGESWAHGDIGVAEEHRASQICVTIVAQLSELFRRRGPVRGTAVTVTPPDERHAIASAMVADFLRAAGYSVHHLGAGIPTADLGMFLRVVPTDLICFSVTQPIAVGDYSDLTRASRDTNPDALVVYGGQGVDAEAAAATGAVVVADLGALADYIQGL